MKDLEVISMGISHKFENFEMLLVLTQENLEMIKITEQGLELFASNPMQNVTKMLVKKDSIFLKQHQKLMHFKMLSTGGDISIEEQPGLPDNAMLTTDFNEICVWTVDDSEVLIIFAALQIQGNLMDLIFPHVLSGSVQVKKNQIIKNMGSTTAFYNDDETMTLITGNFEGKLRFWNLINVGDGYEIMIMREMEFPEHQINFIDKTSGKNSLILGTMLGDVLIIDYEMHCALFRIRFDAEIHHIIEEKTQNSAFLRVAGKDPQFLIKMHIDEGICQMIYPDFQAKPNLPEPKQLKMIEQENEETSEKTKKKKKKDKKKKKKKKKGKKEKKKKDEQENAEENGQNKVENEENEKEEERKQMEEKAKKEKEELETKKR